MFCGNRSRADGLMSGPGFEYLVIRTSVGSTAMADQKHEHGSMDTTEQEKAFAGLMQGTVYTLVIIFLALAFLALTQTS